MNISDSGMILMILTWVCVLIGLWPLLFISRPYRKQKRIARQHISENKTLEGISIVIRCNNDPEGLLTLIDSLNVQQYEGKTEIILSCDPTSKRLKDTVFQVEMMRPDIYVTYVPEDTRNVSRRKLAVYLGVKAAHYDAIVLVTSNTRINSRFWLQSFANRFADGAGIVVAAVKPVNVPGKGLARLLRKFDFTLSTLTWISAALGGRCYRGDSNNLAYSKQLFMDNRGFSNSLNLHYGDDDIFIKELSKRTEVAVNLSADGLVEVECFDERNWEDMARRRMFTLRKLGRLSRVRVSSLTLLIYASITLGVLAIIWNLQNLTFLIASSVAVAAVLLLTTSTVIYSCRYTRTKIHWYEVLPSILFRPVLTIIRRIKMIGEKDLNYTWKRLK